MKKLVNSVLIDMTPEEEAQWRQKMAEMPKPELTPEERMTQIEAALIEVAAMVARGDTL